MKILIVDDERSIVMSTSTYLKTKGYKDIETLTDSKLVVDSIISKKPDVVLLDLNMPQVSGIDILKEVKEKKLSIQLIMISAVNDLDIINECKELGACEFLIKPIDNSLLINKLKTLDNQ